MTFRVQAACRNGVRRASTATRLSATEIQGIGALPGAPSRRPRTLGSTKCSVPLPFSLSAVGLDLSTGRAVVFYRGASGVGPYPGCGGAWGGTILLERSDSGDWRVVDVVNGYMT